MRPDPIVMKRRAILIGVFLLMAGGIWLWSHQTSRALDQRLDDARTAIGELDGLKAELDGLEAQMNELAETDRSPIARVLSEGELPQVLEALSGALSRHGVKDKQVRTETTRRFPRYSVMPISVEFTGSFGQAYAVLSEVEKMAQLVHVDRLNIAAESHEEQDALQVSLLIGAYFTPEGS